MILINSFFDPHTKPFLHTTRCADSKTVLDTIDRGGSPTNASLPKLFPKSQANYDAIFGNDHY